MKKIILSTAIIGTALLSSVAAHASDGTINFTGQLQSSTCSVSSASQTLSVTLPTLATSALAAGVGTVAGSTPFSIAITGCTSGSTATTYFETNANVDQSSGRLNLATGSTATGVQLQLTNSNNSVINLAKPSGSQNVVAAAITGGNATETFAVAYYATSATVGAGSANSNITYSMVYQ
jgi:major type 1 subunit fimbrin (pilin)